MEEKRVANGHLAINEVQCFLCRFHAFQVGSGLLLVIAQVVIDPAQLENH